MSVYRREGVVNAAMENAGPGVLVWGRGSVGLGVSERGRGR